MCAAFQFKKQVFKPGKEIGAVGATGIVRHPWAGFARVEIINWWQRQGGLLLDIYADRFAERSDKTGQLIWEAVPRDFVIRGLVDQQTGQPCIKIVTRASTDDEFLRFQHPRMPVFDEPLFEPQEINFGESAQTELF